MDKPASQQRLEQAREHLVGAAAKSDARLERESKRTPFRAHDPMNYATPKPRAPQGRSKPVSEWGVYELTDEFVERLSYRSGSQWAVRGTELTILRAGIRRWLKEDMTPNDVQLAIANFFRAQEANKVTHPCRYFVKNRDKYARTVQAHVAKQHMNDQLDAYGLDRAKLATMTPAEREHTETVAWLLQMGTVGRADTLRTLRKQQPDAYERLMADPEIAGSVPKDVL